MSQAPIFDVNWKNSFLEFASTNIGAGVKVYDKQINNNDLIFKFDYPVFVWKLSSSLGWTNGDYIPAQFGYIDVKFLDIQDKRITPTSGTVVETSSDISDAEFSEELRIDMYKESDVFLTNVTGIMIRRYGFRSASDTIGATTRALGKLHVLWMKQPST
jgi:hypothetical protein